MGYTSSGDMKRQIRLRFDTEEAAIAYAEKNGIAYLRGRAQEDQPSPQFPMSENFRYDRKVPWTH